MKNLAILSLFCIALASPAAPQAPSGKVQGTVIIEAIIDEKAETESESELEKMNQAGQRISARMGEAMKGGPLAELAALQAMEAEYAGNEYALSSIRTTIAQLLLPRMGDYAGAHRYADLLDPQTIALARSLDPSAFAGYAPANAIKTIVEAAKTRQVLMINEAHHVPQHRAFTLELLGALKEQGFTYFAAETLSQDPDLAKRGYPTGMTGAYIQEPLYGDLVRTALRLGYKIVPYETEDSNSGLEGRERDQARHLQERIFARDPKAKVLVHAGYDHILEIPGSRAMMAAVFKEMTGIDPLTINQEWMTEHSAPEFESPVYRWAAERDLVNEPVIFRDAAGAPWSRSKGVDMAIFHPRSRYENGRPHWLRLGGLRSPYPLLQGICGGAPRCLVKARPVEEGEDAIPIDQILVETGRPAPALMLPAGKFVVRVEDAARKVILEFPAAVQ